MLGTGITEKGFGTIGLLPSRPENLKVILSHETTESDTDGIVEYTLWAKDEEVGTCLQVIRFQHHSHDEARLIARRYKRLLLEGVADLQFLGESNLTLLGIGVH